MNLNNEVRNYRGEIIGFKCFQCGEVKDSMWGTTCNSCRSKSDENAKLRAEIARLTKAVENLKPAEIPTDVIATIAVITS